MLLFHAKQLVPSTFMFAIYNIDGIYLIPLASSQFSQKVKLNPWYVHS